MMKIAFAMINANRRDGSARAVNEVAERLARRGYEVHLFARKAEDLDLELVRWHHVPGPGWPEVADFWSFHTVVNHWLRGAHGFDIVHSIGPNTARADVVTIQNIQPAKRAVLDRFHGQEAVSPLRRWSRQLYLEATSRAEKALYTRQPPPMFLPVSRGVEAELREHYAIGAAPVRIIPNAADPAVFHPIAPEARLVWRKANGVGEGEVVAIFSGGEWARKGLDLAIEATARTSGLRLFVAGDDPDRARFHALAERTGAGKRVIFGGFRADMATAMAASDLFLFPSHYEAFSLATLEAASCGLPIIATRISGTEDLIEPGRNGAFIPPEPEGIAAVLAPLVANAAQRRALGERAAQVVHERYTWERVAEATEAAYREVLAMRASGGLKPGPV